MCSIACSFSRSKLQKLINLNQYRGNFSYSISIFDNIRGIIYSHKDFGKFDFNQVPEKEYLQYYIAHVQSPTGGLLKEYNRIHPSYLSESDSYLWHNGIIKNNSIKHLQQKLSINEEWDTMLLHEDLDTEYFKGLNHIDGSFGCIYIMNKIPTIYVFTSEIITLFIDSEFNISSVKFENSQRITPNIVYNLDIILKKMKLCSNFNSKSSPYYFVD